MFNYLYYKSIFDGSLENGGANIVEVKATIGIPKVKFFSILKIHVDDAIKLYDYNVGRSKKC